MDGHRSAGGARATDAAAMTRVSMNGAAACMGHRAARVTCLAAARTAEMTAGAVDHTVTVAQTGQTGADATHLPRSGDPRRCAFSWSAAVRACSGQVVYLEMCLMACVPEAWRHDDGPLGSSIGYQPELAAVGQCRQCLDICRVGAAGKRGLGRHGCYSWKLMKEELAMVHLAMQRPPESVSSDNGERTTGNLSQPEADGVSHVQEDECGAMELKMCLRHSFLGGCSGASWDARNCVACEWP